MKKIVLAVLIVLLTATLAYTQTCHSVDGLPDPVCTPGAINPAVTQANLAETVCKHNWSASVRPSTEKTDKLKKLSCAEYGYHGPLRKAELDHLRPISSGGALFDPLNLWCEPNYIPKDQVEKVVHRELCAGKITLKRAGEIFTSGYWAKCLGKKECL